MKLCVTSVQVDGEAEIVVRGASLRDGIFQPVAVLAAAGVADVALKAVAWNNKNREIIIELFDPQILLR